MPSASTSWPATCATAWSWPGSRTSKSRAGKSLARWRTPPMPRSSTSTATASRTSSSPTWEAPVAFLGDGMGGFEKKTIFQGPHPAYGSSGIQTVDMNGDGKLDVLYSNGDTRDAPHLLKPYHGVQWLENPGDGTFPWKHHPI